ncbi:MAG: glycosyltransferase family 39 protein [Candidatus Daviesbacteria bacterium]|nr:glycosyltransferase family 39 protein [Candidatus Daviesbacteria bacterium]
MIKQKYILLIVILLGLALRLININTNPISLYGDELTITLDAYSLLKTGQDQLGNFLPLTFPMGAGRPAGYVYGSVPFIAIFGPTALGVRMLSVLSGVGIIILLYLLGKKVLDKKVGLAAAVVAAVSPWDILLSRGGFEAHFALFLVLLGTYLFLQAKQKPVFYLFSFLSFGLTLHTYPTYKVSLLLFLPLLFWYQGGIRKFVKEGSKYFISGVAILIILGVLILSQSFIGGSEKRFSDINIFSKATLNASIEQKINLERQTSQLPKQLVKFFHNKPVEYTKVFIENYLQNFSLDFLILHGDRNPRHNMATMGGLYAVELILIMTFVLAFWQKTRKLLLFLILWIILSPIPTAIVDLPHALRSSFMLPPLIILSAGGLITVMKLRKKRFFYLVVIFFIIQFIFFGQKLFFLAPYAYSAFWSYPAKVASEMVSVNKEKYDFIVLSNRINDIEFAYPVYSRIEPKILISQNQNKTMLSGNPVRKIENVYFGSIEEDQLMKFINNLPGSVLYIGSRSDKRHLENYEIVTDFNNEEILIIKRKP